MPETLTLDIFMDRARRTTVVDVRSPGEFARGHMPGAVNVPLFSDEERAEIGTSYVREGRLPAVMLGLARVGPRMADMGAQLLDLDRGADGGLLVHCWRGGMRSASVAWLAEMLGCRVATLAGGYKSFRRWVIESTGCGREIRVVAGLTGTGKTHVLRALAARGENVIDLEKLAHHKGSAFGDLGEEKPPTQEQFENDLALAWRDTRSDAAVWVEDESRNIGKLTLPQIFWQAKEAAPRCLIELPEEARLAHLCEVYSRHPAEVLAARVESIRRRLGGDRAAAAARAVMDGDLHEACRIVLTYYDRAYRASLQFRPPEMLRAFAFERLDPAAIAEVLCSAASPLTHS